MTAHVMALLVKYHAFKTGDEQIHSICCDVEHVSINGTTYYRREGEALLMMTGREKPTVAKEGATVGT